MANPDESEDSTQWDPEKVDELLKMERSVNTEAEISNIDLTRKLIEQAAPHAAMSMIHLSRHAVNENTKMNASKWVVEFATQIETEDGKAAWEKLLPSIVDEAEAIVVHAASQGDTPLPGTDYTIGD